MQRAKNSMVKSHEATLATTAKPLVFISYAWGDGPPQIVEALTLKLAGADFDVYWDKRGEGGPAGPLQELILEKLGRATAAVVLLSAKYYAQEPDSFSRLEITAIKARMQEKTIVVVPLLYESCEYPFNRKRLGVEWQKLGNLHREVGKSPIFLNEATEGEKSRTYDNVVTLLHDGIARVGSDIKLPMNSRVPSVSSRPAWPTKCALHILDQICWVRWRASRFEIAPSTILSDQGELDQAQSIAVDGAGEVIGCLDSRSGHVRLAWLNRFSTALSNWPHTFCFNQLKDASLLAIKRIGDTGVRMIVSNSMETRSLWLSTAMSPDDELDQGERLSSSSSSAAVWLPDGPLLIEPDKGRPSRAAHGLTLDEVQHIDAAEISRNGTTRTGSAPSDHTKQCLVAAIGLKNGAQLLEVRFADGTGHVVPFNEPSPALVTVIRNGDDKRCLVVHGNGRDSIRSLSLEA